MQGLEFVDVPGLVILATGASVMGAMLLAGLGWRKLDRQMLERLHTSVKTNIVLREIYAALSSHADSSEEVSETSAIDAIDKNAWKNGLIEPNRDDEITGQYILTSADRDLLKRGPAIRPVPVRRKAI